MGDTTDGSSAAHSAQFDQREPDQRGFFGRFLSGRNADDQEELTTEPRRPAIIGPVLGLANLRRLRVVDVAIPKAEIVAAPLDMGRSALVEVFRESGFSRLPIYSDTLDKPVGLLLLKDLALKYGFNGVSDDLDLQPLLRPLLFVPPSMPLTVLLQKMQTERMHMALVIDEYGGVDGLVTIEDLLEQVVGEIEDEHDTEEEGNFQLEKPGIYLAQARTPMEEFEAEIGFQLVDPADDEEIDTLGGLVFVLTGRVPARGEVIAHPTGVEIEVVDADPRRIKRLRVRLPEALVS
jgi:magnesium and cobalt transporter